MFENKRGQELTLGTVILIVLGIVVLIFLIFGFSTGWGNLWSRITGLGGGKMNIDTIKSSCTLACQQSAQYEFCNQQRSVYMNDTYYNSTATCKDLTMQVKFSDTPDGNKDVYLHDAVVAPCSSLC